MSILNENKNRNIRNILFNERKWINKNKKMDKEEEGTALYNEIESKMIWQNVKQNDLKYEYTMLEH